MGMFDHVEFETICPKPGCRTLVKGFQSKDGPCQLLTVQPVDVSNFYSNCPKCGTRIQFESGVGMVKARTFDVLANGVKCGTFKAKRKKQFVYRGPED